MISRPAEPEVPVIPEFTPGETSLAVLCFRNDSGDADMDIWEKGLAQALTLDLLQSPSLKVVEGSRLFHALLPLKLSEKRRRKYTQSDLRRMAGVSGASVFMTGSITRSGKGFKLHTVLKEASGNSLFSESFDCSGEDEMLSRVDDLADWVRANLPVSREDTAPERNRDVQDITTDTAEPFKDYVRGKWHFWRKDYSQAIAAFISSLEYDPEFALGHMELAAAYKASGYPDRARKQLQTAQGLIDQLSERDRYHLQGEFYRLSEKTYDIALKVYLRLLELYPDDPRANTHLGMLYTQLNRWEEAAERFQVNIKNRVIEPDSYLGYATNYIQQGMFSEAENVLLGYFNRHQDNADIRLHLAWLHLLQRDYNAALSELEKGLSLNPSCYLHLLKGDLQMLRGDLIAAQAEYTRLQQMEDPLSHLWGRQRMADLHLLKGKFQQAREQLHAGLQEAVSQDELGWKYRFHLDLARFFLDSGNPVQTLRQCEQAWEIAVPGDTAVFPREVLHLQGLAYLALNRRSDLNKTVLRLKSLCQKGPVLDRMRYFYHLKGEIEMAGGNYTQAITYFGQAFNHLPPQGKPWEPGNDHALFIDSLSDALYAGGKPSEALEKLEELRALSAGRLAYGDLYARCFYKLGKIREENGMRDIATEFYHRFLALWEDADPGIPELSDARQRIAASQGR
jgi:tetratricopeptide (TPR) repeat protein